MARVSGLEAYAALFEPRGVVIACAKRGRAVRWRGHELACREGWIWQLGPKGLVWRCEECGGEAEVEHGRV